MLDTLMSSIIRKVRPNASTDVALNQLIGWYARKGAIPVLRGLLWYPRLGSANFPIFFGAGVRVAYSKSIRLGKGVSIGANTRILALSSDGISIGPGATIRENAWIQCASSPANPGVSLNIGRGAYIGPGSVIGVGGPITIGDECQIGASFIVVAENHAVDDYGPSSTTVSRQGINIGAGCWIGHRVTVLDGVTLGKRCTVGAGAVVTKSFPPGSVIGGVPARLLRPNTGDNLDVNR